MSGLRATISLHLSPEPSCSSAMLHNSSPGRTWYGREAGWGEALARSSGVSDLVVAVADAVGAGDG